MIRINFCKSGASVSDWDIDGTVEFLKKTALIKPEYKDYPEWVYDYSNFLILDALRAEIAEDKISLDNISFSVDDVPLEVDKRGRLPSYPKEAELRDGYYERLLGV